MMIVMMILIHIPKRQFKQVYKMQMMSPSQVKQHPNEGVKFMNYRMTTNFGEANVWQLAQNLQLAEF